MFYKRSKFYWNKLFIIVLFLFISIITSAKTYYVAQPGGSDSYPGTLTQPWASLQKAIETAKAGDTVYFRGGSYYPSTYEYGSDVFHYNPDNSRGHSGTAENRIYYMNYPGETPIIDFKNIIPPSNYNIGLYMENVHYVSWYGLTFQNLSPAGLGPTVNVIEGHRCSNLHFERIICKNNGGAAFRYFSGIGEDVGITTDTTKYINCDAFNNVDNSGNYADGFKYDQDKGAYVLFEGCRAIGNSDDGFDASGSAMRIFKNNWSIANGYAPEGNGNGIKTGALRDTLDYSSIILVNNLAAYNHSEDATGGYGFLIVDYQVSDTSYHRANARFYNNTAYHNDFGFGEHSNPLWNFRNCVYRNNIAYMSQFIQDGIRINVMMLTYPYPESHNTWDMESGGYSFVETDTVTITDLDFLSVDTTGIRGARQSDGSLPDIDFMRLVSSSDLIDAGVDVGLPYCGTAPDLGYSEYLTGSIIISNPVYIGSVIENATPGRLEMTYSLILANVVPAASSFSVRVNSVNRNVSSVAIAGNKVMLTLTSPVVFGDIVTVAYTKPTTNPLQTTSGGQAATISAQTVKNNCLDPTTPPNQPPVISISSPTKNSSFMAPAIIEIEAVASDPDGTIRKVEFYNGNIKLFELTSTPYSYTWKDVGPGTYSLTAIATDNLNATATTSAVEVVVVLVTPVYDPYSEILNLYPNPNDGHFTIELLTSLQNEMNIVTVVNMTGESVYKGIMLKEEDTRQFDLPNLKSGIYVLMIIGDEIIVTKKFIRK